MRTLAQERSRFALQKLAQLGVSEEDFIREVTGFPSLVLQNGFGQALAFNLSKDVKEKTAVVNLVREWLHERRHVRAANNRQFMESLSQMEVGRYLAAQREALEFLNWVKRYANARLFGR